MPEGMSADEIAMYRAIFQGAVQFDRKWKDIPASDARLKAMANLYYRDRNTIHYMELNKSLSGLKPDEYKKLHQFWEEKRKESE